MEFWKGCALRSVYFNGEIILSVYYSQRKLEDDLEVDVSNLLRFPCIVSNWFYWNSKLRFHSNCESVHKVLILSTLSLFYSIQIDFVITKSRIKNINEGMVGTPKLGKRVKKEAVSEEDKERD